jgi:glycosyltransferase involved in cell wall biosynthesis
VSADGFASAPKPRGDVFTVGYFARIAPEKGLHVLCDAYRAMRQRTPGIAMRLRAGGYLGPENKVYLADVQRRMRDWGLGHEFEYAGAPDREGKLAFFKSLDVFSVPATHPEAKGLSVLEAMGNAVPVVQPREGAFPEMVERAGGGLLVPPNDPLALADRMLHIWRDAALADRLGRAGAAGVREHYSVDAMAASMEGVYMACCS